jgi:hypothetical protein
MKNPTDPIRNQTHNLPACRAMPQPIAPLCIPHIINYPILIFIPKYKIDLSYLRWQCQKLQFMQTICTHLQIKIWLNELSLNLNKAYITASMHKLSITFTPQRKVKFMQNRSRWPRWGIEVYLSLTLALDGSGCLKPCPNHFTTRSDPVPIVQEGGWALGPVWTSAENFTPYRHSIPGPSSP